MNIYANPQLQWCHTTNRSADREILRDNLHNEKVYSINKGTPGDVRHVKGIDFDTEFGGFSY